MPGEAVVQTAQTTCHEINISLVVSIIALVVSGMSLITSVLIIWNYQKLDMQKLKSKIKKFVFGEKLYKEIKENGLNVLVETEGSKAKTDKRRFLINVLLTVISALAAVVAAIFAALTYINA